MKATVIVRLKEGVLDPQGQAICRSLNKMGHGQISNVRQGKYFEIDIDEKNQKKAEEKVEEMCDKLLANLVIENYKIIEIQ